MTKYSSVLTYCVVLDFEIDSSGLVTYNSVNRGSIPLPFPFPKKEPHQDLSSICIKKIKKKNYCVVLVDERLLDLSKITSNMVMDQLG